MRGRYCSLAKGDWSIVPENLKGARGNPMFAGLICGTSEIPRATIFEQGIPRKRTGTQYPKLETILKISPGLKTPME